MWAWASGGRRPAASPLGRWPWGGTALGGLVWVSLGWVWAPYLAPSLLSAEDVAVAGKGPGVRAGPVPCAGGLPGGVARLAAVAALAPCASGAPPGGGAVGAAVWGAGAASPACAESGAGGSGSLAAAWGCSAGGPTPTAASSSCRSSCSAGGCPAHPGEMGKRELDWRWWRLSC